MKKGLKVRDTHANLMQFGSKKKDVDDFIEAEFSKINGGAS
jgi:hypothetical protein